jgi:hypothetical protein
MQLLPKSNQLGEESKRNSNIVCLSDSFPRSIRKNLRRKTIAAIEIQRLIRGFFTFRKFRRDILYEREHWRENKDQFQRLK